MDVNVKIEVDQPRIKDIVDSELIKSVLNMCDDRPQVICLCGSTKFKDTFLEAQKLLTLQGCVVLSVGCFGHADGHNWDDDTKIALDRLHKWKIKMSDSIVVCHENGYVGSSTKSEIEFASKLRKSIKWFSLEKLTFDDEYTG